VLQHSKKEGGRNMDHEGLCLIGAIVIVIVVIVCISVCSVREIWNFKDQAPISLKKIQEEMGEWKIRENIEHGDEYVGFEMILDGKKGKEERKVRLTPEDYLLLRKKLEENKKIKNLLGEAKKKAKKKKSLSPLLEPER
jgi:hypothetical protein